jgi:MFS family permease
MRTVQNAGDNSVKALWRAERRARWFFAAHLQSALGTGAGYVALLVLAYDRLGSAWGATAVLLADLAPAMLLGPLLGRLVDRTSRLGCALAADALGALAFAALAFVPGTVPLVALALAAGVGSALLRPATGALLPAVVAEHRLGPANAVFGAVRELGQLLGPVCAAGLLLAGGPSVVLVLNAVTFAASCALLARLRGHVRAAEREPAGDAPAQGGVLRLRQARRLILTSGAVIFTCGTTNVAELVLAKTDLHAGGTGFGLLVSAYACGMLVGSLLGNLDEEAVVVRYLAAIAALGLGLLGSAGAPTLPFALVSFALAGAGNGLFVVVGRLLLTRAVPDSLHGRAFGVLDAVDSWGFGAAVLLGGALVAAVGGRVTFALAGAATLFVLALAAAAARSAKGGVSWVASGTASGNRLTEATA